MFLAWFSYRLYYPPLTDIACHKPYAPRIPEADYTSSQYEGRVPSGGDSEDGVFPGREGPEGTLKRPNDGMGQDGMGFPLRTQSSSTVPQSSGHQVQYSDLESGRR